MAWYRYGSVNLTNGSAVVTGSGTLWANQVKAGDIFTQDETRLYEIKSVDSDTQITLTEAYVGATANATAYAIIIAFNATTNADLSSRISKLIQNYQTNTDQMIDWLGGVAGGGTNSDGKYPITDFYGNTSYVKSPAQLQADYLAMQNSVAITGGTINGTVIGGTTPAAITATTLYTSSWLTVEGTATIAGGVTVGSQNHAFDDQGSYARVQSYNGKPLALNPLGNRVLINTTADDGSSALQVGGIGTFSGKVFANRLLLNGATDDGSTALQVNGTIGASGTIKSSAATGLAITTTGATNAQINLTPGNGGDSFSIGAAQGANGYFYIYDNAKGLQPVTVWNTGRVGIGNGAADNGIDALQVNDTVYATGYKSWQSPWPPTPVAGAGEFGAGTGYGAFACGQGSTYDSALLNRSANVGIGVFANSIRVGIAGATDNGTDALQVNGYAHVQAVSASAQIKFGRAGDSVGGGAIGGDSGYMFRIYDGALSANPFNIAQSGRVLINTTTDNGTDALQVAGSANVTTGVSIRGYTGGHSGTGVNLEIGSVNSHAVLNSFDRTNSVYSPLVLQDSNSGRVLISTITDNGTDTLQVNGMVNASAYKFAGGNGIYQNSAGATYLGPNAHWTPYTDNAWQCGTSALRWSSVWSVNGTVQTSDARLKTDFAASLGLDFINQLNPVSYRWRENDNGIHHGLIAQEVDALLARLGVKSFAGLSKPEDGYMGLQYSEFIAPLIKAVQELTERVNQLEKEKA